MGYLRLLMALCVAIGHAHILHYAPKELLPYLSIGSGRGTAVHFFFILSGFFMHLLITEKFYGRAGWVAAFYKSRALRFTLLLALTLLISGYYYAHHVFRPHFYAEFCYFVLGAASYRFYVKLRPHAAGWQRYEPLAYGLIVMLALWQINFRFLARHMGVDVAYMGFIVMIVVGIPFLVLALKSHPLERFIGNMAYPFFLFHLLVFNVIDALGLMPKNMVVYPGLPITLLVAFLLVRYVDIPIRRRAKIPPSRP